MLSRKEKRVIFSSRAKRWKCFEDEPHPLALHESLVLVGNHPLQKFFPVSNIFLVFACRLVISQDSRCSTLRPLPCLHQPGLAVVLSRNL